MLRIQYAIEAEREIDVAFEWYMNRSPKAAAAFLAELCAITLHIRKSPHHFPLVAPTLRKATLQQYPYSLLFRKKDSEIQVLVVAHSKRQPGYWKDRT